MHWRSYNLAPKWCIASAVACCVVLIGVWGLLTRQPQRPPTPPSRDGSRSMLHYIEPTRTCASPPPKTRY
jgi:hypothetical protein